MPWAACSSVAPGGCLDSEGPSARCGPWSQEELSDNNYKELQPLMAQLTASWESSPYTRWFLLSCLGHMT